MKRFVFTALMTSLALTATALAPAWSTPHLAAPEAQQVARVAQTTTSPWTCAHNTYRSVACP